MVVWIIVFVVSLLALLKSADIFTDGAEELGIFLGAPQYLVGVTIVAIGTSLPELIGSVFAVVEGSPEIVAGNAVGANVSNLLLVLGVAAIASGRLLAGRGIPKVDLSVLASSAALFALAALDGTISRGEGLLLLAGAFIYGVHSVKVYGAARVVFGQDQAVDSTDARPIRPPFRVLAPLKLVGGAVVLYFAAEYTIRSVIQLSELLDIGAEVIAISALSIGTTLPELIVSLMAARRGRHEIAMGNILGSSVFNLFAVVGIPALIVPLPVTDVVLTIGLPFMAIATVLFFFTARDGEVTRWEGMPLILLYILFLGKLFGFF